MLPIDIATRVKRQFGDESGVQVTDADILRWINDAQQEAVMQMPDLILANIPVDTVIGQQFYTLSDSLPADGNIIDVRFVNRKDEIQDIYYPLTYMSHQQLNDYVPGWYGTASSSGTPTIWTKSLSGTPAQIFNILVYPVPDKVIIGGIRAVVSRYASNVVLLNDEMDLPQYLHGYVMEYCLMKAYELDEEWEAADRKAQYVQSTLDFNNHREMWGSKDYYPSITSSSGDM